MKIDLIKCISGWATLFVLVLMATMNMCSGRSLDSGNSIDKQTTENSNIGINMISDENLPAREMRSKMFEPESSESKEFKNHHQMNSDIRRRLMAGMLFGKSEQPSPFHCSSSSSHDSGASMQNTNSASSSSFSSSSASSSSSSSSFSSSSDHASTGSGNQANVFPVQSSAVSASNSKPTNGDYYSSHIFGMAVERGEC